MTDLEIVAIVVIFIALAVWGKKTTWLRDRWVRSRRKMEEDN